jgi:hypothetical protein
VFPGQKGGFRPLGESRWAFDKACAEVGIADLVPLGLRHTTASPAISAGANVKVVQRQLGHTAAAMTLDRYGHLLSDDLAGVAWSLSKQSKLLGYHCGIQRGAETEDEVVNTPLSCIAPIAQLAEAADLKSAQCRFESDWGH